MNPTKSRRLHIFRELLPFVRNNKSTSVYIIIFKFLSTIVLLVTPLVYRYFINDVIMDNKLSNLLFVILGYLGLYGFQSVFTVAFTFFENKFKNLLRVNIKKKLLTVYANIKMKEFQRYGKGDLRNIVEEDTKKLEVFFSKNCVNFVFSIFYIVMLNVVMFTLDWHMAVFGLLMILLSFFITKFIGGKLKHVSGKYRQNIGEFEGLIHRSLQNWKEIKLNNLEKQEEEELASKWKHISGLIMKQTFYNYLTVALNVLNLLVITRVSLYFFGGILIYQKLINVATMLVFINYYDQLNNETTKLTDSIIQFKNDEPQLERIINMMKAEVKIKPNRKLVGDIVLDKVSFSYPESQNIVLDKVSVVIPQNSHVAIVGASGSGKSTLAKLLLGLFEPKEGSIFIGYVNIHSVSEVSLRHTISAVMQDPLFFNISIADNLLLVKGNATIKEIEHVCRLANIHDFIQSTPDKYNTIIGERGIKLSGGQLQRLAIARTLLADPDIIIFDEATSSLDSENEQGILQAIHHISKNKTIITIAHRLVTIMESDYIIMLKNGQIIAQGDSKKIIQQNEDISSLFQIKN